MATDAEHKSAIMELEGRARDRGISGLIEKVGAILAVVIVGLAQRIEDPDRPRHHDQMTIQNPWDEVDIEEFKHLVRSNRAAASRRGVPSLRHAPNRFRSAQEVDVCADFARSLLNQSGCSIQGIYKNETTDFPDCFATLDGKVIGIEVTELMDPDQAYSEWPRTRFCREVSKAIRKKDEKAPKDDRLELLRKLSQLILVIHMDEADLTSTSLRKHLDALEFPKPVNIYQAFVLGPYEPMDNPHIRGREREYEESDELPRCTAFPVRLSGRQ